MRLCGRLTNSRGDVGQHDDRPPADRKSGGIRDVRKFALSLHGHARTLPLLARFRPNFRNPSISIKYGYAAGNVVSWSTAVTVELRRYTGIATRVGEGVRGSRVVAGIGFAVLGSAAGAADRSVTWPEQLAEVRTSLEVGDRGFKGAGAGLLARAVSDARYVLIGEDHLTREIPEFTANLCRLMAPQGLAALAVEIGPEAANVVNANLRLPDRRERIGAFMRSHPDSMAFQNGSDENDMAAACAEASGVGFHLWGLDQEFFGATGNLLERMASAQPGPVAHMAIKRLSAAEHSATKAALASGSPGQLLIYTITEEQLADARAAIERDGGSRVQALFAAFEKTRAIYLGQNTNPYESNCARAKLMKRTLLDYLKGTFPKARVLFKFGDVHMGKGINSLGQRDLGNFVAERAEGEGVGSLHLLVLGRRGTHALYNGVGRQVRLEPFELTDDADFMWLKDALPTNENSSKEWILLDLRPLRAKPPHDLPEASHRIIKAFDMIVVAPIITPSHVLGAR